MDSTKKSGAIFEFIKGQIIAIIFSLLMVLIFAALIKFCGIDSNFIPIVNQIIKSLSIFIGIITSFSKRPNGWLRGFLFGLVYILLSFVVFSAFNTQFIFDISLLNDCVLGGISGLISGIIAVNAKKVKA